MKVWKFPLPPPCDYFEIQAPAGTQWLHVAEQHGAPVLWGLVHQPDATSVRYGFRWAGTGYPIEDKWVAYVGTFQQAGGDLVWHIFNVETRSQWE